MIVRGFIDLHTHGINKYDTKTGNPEHILKIAELHGLAGIGAILPTIYPASIDEMRKNIGAVRKAMDAQKFISTKVQSVNPPSSPFRKGGANHSLHITHHSSLILGVNLEGPFLNPLLCGALDKKSFIKPALSSLKKLIYGYEDIIKVITIAPEIKGALKVIEKCSGLGIKVNMGHSNATYKQALDGKKAGATGITHIFNAMRQFHHREPWLAGLGLIDEDLYIEVIADGVHLHTKTIELIFNRKRLDRIILVSDSIKGPKTRKGAVYNKKKILCGSSMTISDSVKILKDIGIPDAEIIESAKDNPARYIGLKL